MKCTILLVAVIIACAGAQPEVIRRPPPYYTPPFSFPFGHSGPSTEGILDNLKNFGKKTLQGLKSISSVVGKELLGVAAQLLTDNLKLQPSPGVQSALDSNHSTEGIFQELGKLIEKRAREALVAQYPSQEGILHEVGPYYTIPYVEENLHFRYNHSAHAEGPSHEGIFGNLGGLVLGGLGDLVGGTAGNVIKGAGNLLGNFFFALPPQPGASQEGIISSKLGKKSGILEGIADILARGAPKIARGLLTGSLQPYADLLRGTLFLARGQYNRYPNIQAPGQEALLNARNLIHHHNFSSANVCVDAAEKNLTQLLEQYVQNGHGCVNSSFNLGQPIVHHTFDIVLDAVKRVEDAHHEASNCFTKLHAANRHRCLEQEVPALIQAHSEKFSQYGEHLADFVRQFSDVNTQFDVCLTKHLGTIRREVYRVISNFHSCVEQQEASNPPAPAKAA